MLSSLTVSALVMGLVGGPHCVVMCGAACAGIARAAEPRSTWALWQFQIFRLLGYSALGAVVGGSVQGLAWLGQHTAVLRPVWTMMHVAAWVLGAWLLWQARQPAWVDDWGQRVWRALRPVLQRLGPRAPVLLGLGWAFMPCGLLYSALMVASLSASVWQGGAIMAAFAAGTMVSLVLGPYLLLKLKDVRSGAWGIRLAGVALMAVSSWALWRGITQPTGLWCL